MFNKRKVVLGCKNKGFTLIELLVVISIIALLMAVLMPALQRAREQAKSVVCRTNLKQMGLSFVIYAEHNSGRFPPYCSGGDMWWPRYTSKYLGEDKKTVNWYDNKTFFCPNEKKWPYSSYAMNIKASNVVLANVKSASSKVLLADGVTIGTGWSLVLSYPNPSPHTAIAYRHTGKANILFFDGSVDTIKDEERGAINSGSPAFWEPLH